MERILAAVDGSASSMKAVALAADLAGKYGAELVLVAVARETAPAADAVLAVYAHTKEVDMAGSDPGFVGAENVLAGARLRARENGAARIATEVASGDPAEAIIGLAVD